MIGSFFQRWRSSAAELYVVLAVLQLPLALLFSYRSRLFYQTLWELVQDTSLLVVVYFAVAVLIGFVVAVIGSAIQLVSARRAEQFMAATVFGYCVLALASMQPFAQKWWWQMLAILQRVRGVPVPVNIVPYLFWLFVLLLALYAWRKGFVTASQRLSASLHNGLRFAIGLLVVCATLALVTGHMYWRGFGWSATQTSATSPTPQAPDVILISIDTLAATDMSLYGYERRTTPELDRFAGGAYVFDHFLANSNYTTPTVTSMITGRYPTAHTVYHHYAGIRPEHRAFNIAHVLKERGYTTAAVASNPMAHPMNIGVADDFDYVSAIASDSPGHFAFRVFGFTRADLAAFCWDWWLGPAVREIVPRIPLDDIQRKPWYPPARVIDQAKAIVEEHRQPLFLWTHFFAPHEPYISPKPYMGSLLSNGDYDTLYEELVKHPIAGLYGPAQQPRVDELRARYDEDIAWVDHEVGGFLDWLDAHGGKDALVIVTADHGESFEHGWRGHSGPMLHQPLLHIPLIVRLPRQAAGQRVASNAEQVDLLPTVLDALKLPLPPWADGESLLPMMLEGRESTRTKYSASVYRSPRFQPLTDGTVAAFQGTHKLVRYLASGCEELYDLAADPHERTNLASTDAAMATQLRETIPKLIGVPVPPGRKNADCSRPWGPGIQDE
ncbi:MAG TPA: sulfatase [Nevskiaceae bacterium]|nr:sulfatase [Nevskiaceae bacterium]